MRELHIFLWLALATSTLCAQESLRDQIERAVSRTATFDSAADLHQSAQLAYERARRAWWPSISLDAPALLSGSGNQEGPTISTTMTLALAQKLPGSGSLTSTYTQTWFKSQFTPSGIPTDLTTVPKITFSLIQPLAQGLWGPEGDLGDQRANTARQLADGKKLKANQTAFFSVLSAAAALDTARAALDWRRFDAKAMEDRAQEVSAWKSQGRASAVEEWKSKRDRETAEWNLEKASLDVKAREREWLRLVGTTAPSWSLRQVLELSEQLRTDPPYAATLDEQIDTLSLRLERQDSLATQTAWLPQVSMAASAQKPEALPWVYSAQLGLKISSDLLFLAPLDVDQSKATRGAQKRLIEQSSSDRQGQQEDRLASIRETSAYLDLLFRELLGHEAFVQETRRLVETGSLPLTELSSLEATQASLLAEQRRLHWDLIMLQAQTSK